MSLTLGDNFSYQGAKPLDARLKYDTLATMKAVADATMYEGCMGYCVETDKTYQWKSTNTVDADTGKWREFSSGGGGTSDYPDLTNKPSINNVTLNGNKTASDLGLAKSSDIPTKSSLGLGNVVNTGDSDTPTSGGTTKFTTGGAYTLKQSINKAYKSDDTAETALADADKFPFYDSSASAKRSSTWSNIKSVLKTYFDTLYNKVTNGTGLTLTNGTMAIKEFESGDMDDVIPELPEGNVLVSIANSFNRGDIYSTSERMIGQWSDGKPLYAKTITYSISTNYTSEQQVNISTGLTNCSLKNLSCCYVDSDSGVLPFKSGDAYNAFLNGFTNSTGQLSMNIKGDWRGVTLYITLKYTKTTDSSISIGEENEYSTSEKIVGTWINGEKLYQKTISTVIQSSTSKTLNVAHGISNFKTAVSCVGIVQASDWSCPLPFVDITASNKSISIDTIDSTNIQWRFGSSIDMSSWAGKLYTTIQYIKTS